MKYECPCGYVYDPALGDPENGVAPGTAWEDVPEDWVCPTCGLGEGFDPSPLFTYVYVICDLVYLLAIKTMSFPFQ